MEKLNLTQEWDKVFPKSDKVDHKKVTFHNRYGITLAADMYTPKSVVDKLPAIAVSGPFGAVKEQSSGLYAQKMAELGFLTIAFDPSYTGESGGTPRYVASPDINTEDFCAAVDFLSVQENVDSERIGIIGICGWGGMAINAAAIDTRIKATAAMTMYDMTRVTANGYFDAEDSEQARFEKKKAMNAQRIEDYKSGSYALAGGVVDPLPEDAPQFVKDYYAYYKTPRGYHPRSLNSNGGWNVTSSLSFLNMPILQYSSEIRSAVLLVHGEKAHSRYFSETVYSKQKPVPFGEFVPYRELVMLLVPPLADIGMLENDLLVGDRSEVFDLGVGRVGSLICFDSIYESTALDSVRRGAQLLAVSTNDSCSRTRAASGCTTRSPACGQSKPGGMSSGRATRACPPSSIRPGRSRRSWIRF